MVRVNTGPTSGSQDTLNPETKHNTNLDTNPIFKKESQPFHEQP